MSESALQPSAPPTATPRLPTALAASGLPRPAALTPVVDRHLATCRRNGTSIVVVLVGLDDFDAVAMRHGPAIADRLLEAAWHRFRGRLRASDVTLRLEGAEFGAVLLNAAASAAVSVGSRLPAALSELYSVEALEVAISARIGLAVYPLGGTTGDALVRAARQVSTADRRIA